MLYSLHIPTSRLLLSHFVKARVQIQTAGLLVLTIETHSMYQENTISTISLTVLAAVIHLQADLSTVLTTTIQKKKLLNLLLQQAA